jgi:P pilus assembly chaperone PapD
MMRRIIPKIAVLGLSLFLTVQTLCGHAAYQINPLRLEVNYQPQRKTTSSVVTIQNTSDETLRLKAYLENWSIDEEGRITNEDSAYSLPSESVRFNPKEFEIPPGESQIVRLGITLPENLTDGEYRKLLFFEDLKPKTQLIDTGNSKVGASIVVKQRIGLAIYVYKGQLQPAAKVEQFACTFTNGRLKPDIRLINPGNRHYRANGSIVISQLSQGKYVPVSEHSLQDLGDIIVLPASKLHVEPPVITEEKLTKPGKYKVELSLADKENPKNLPLESSYELDVPDAASSTAK